MEASATATREPLRSAPSRTSRTFGNQVAESFTAPVRSMLKELGQMASFSGRALKETPRVGYYAAEVLRQVGILIVGSAMVIVFMEFVIGLECATEGNYVLRGYGATVYSGVFTALCSQREMTPMMFGYIASAKIGTGLVAQLGSMRIGDEIDALESVGISSMRYLVATRLVAMWLMLPFFFIIGLAATTLGAYTVIVLQIGEVSKGGWETVHFAFTVPIDLLYSFIKLSVMGTVIVLVGMYYGYNARGGPVGVGSATARSMIVNLVAVHVINAALTMLFWGFTPRTPIGG